MNGSCGRQRTLQHWGGVGAVAACSFQLCGVVRHLPPPTKKGKRGCGLVIAPNHSSCSRVSSRARNFGSLHLLNTVLAQSVHNYPYRRNALTVRSRTLVPRFRHQVALDDVHVISREYLLVLSTSELRVLSVVKASLCKSMYYEV